MKVCEGWNEFLEEMQETALPVVCFGAGAVPWFVEPLFEKLGIWERIRFFLDNDKKKAGTWVGENRKVPVVSVDAFREMGIRSFLMLVTCENFIPILEQLQQVEEWREIPCYIYIKLNRELLKAREPAWKLTPGKPLRIPKMIHYCWFGGKEKSELHRRCLRSWREKCPDYEIIEWNETNYDVYQNRYMREAYESGKWAYVSDYARLDLLYRYGGIYLDTDVELLENLDVLLGEQGFIAYGQWPAVNSGAGMGCVKGLPVVKEMRDDPRGELSFFHADGTFNMLQNGFYESRVLRRYGFSQDFTMQYLGELLVLAPEILATASVLGRDIFVTERTLAVHHCGGSWKE